MVTEGTKRRRLADQRLRRAAQRMRREPTLAEAVFWHHAKGRMVGGLKFRRQVPVGPYVADYLCAEKSLVVEIDGGQHNGSERDETRDRWLESQGYRVMRFWNSDVLADIESVIETILASLAPPHPALSPGGGEEE